MKKLLIGLGIIILSLFITFVVFEMLSWYHFGDIPTKVVLIRLIIFFMILLLIFTGIFLLIKKWR